LKVYLVLPWNRRSWFPWTDGAYRCRKYGNGCEDSLLYCWTSVEIIEF